MVMDYRGYGFTREGSKRFYRDIEKKKEDINKMEISEDVREDLLNQTEKLVEEYERSKIRHINTKIYEIRTKSNIKKQNKKVKKIKSKLEEINDNLGHIKKNHVFGKHLMYGDNSYN
ncbi:MAG TPA: hypothetical protein VJ912_01285 [Candidatus Nanoarchaeia archaeon]|nr:hypothetical protein [Candidatus Nanoarchaeia archaeon]